MGSRSIYSKLLMVALDFRHHKIMLKWKNFYIIKGKVIC